MNSIEEQADPGKWLVSEDAMADEQLFRTSSFVIYPNRSIWNWVLHYLHLPINVEKGRILAEAAERAGTDVVVEILLFHIFIVL